MSVSTQIKSEYLCKSAAPLLSLSLSKSVKVLKILLLHVCLLKFVVDLSLIRSILLFQREDWQRSSPADYRE